MFLLIGAIIGVICGFIAHSKGRSPIGWFFIGFLLGLIGLIICIVMPNLKEQREKETQMLMEQRRLEEQLRQERIKNERFQQYAQKRFDIHDETLKIDTRQPFPEKQAGFVGMIEARQPNHHDENGTQSDIENTEVNEVIDISAGSSDQQNGWYFQYQGLDRGPLSIRQIRDYIAAGTIEQSTPVWHTSFVDWMPASQIGLFDFGEAV